MTQVCDRLEGAGELALRTHGLTGERLLRMAYAVANTYARRTGSGLQERIDDLAQHLALTATRRALNFKPELTSQSFTSYLWDIMEPACIDWHRRKSEGFGDRRYGHDGRITLVAQITEHGTTPEPADEPTYVQPAVLAFWRALSRSVEPKITERRLRDWAHAANTVGLPMQDWVAITLDHASKAFKEAA